MSSNNENNVGQPQNTEMPRRNIILAHDEKSGEHKTPPTVSGPVSIGGVATIQLPDLETQKAGFVLPLEERELLLLQYPGTYKALLPSHALPARQAETPQGLKTLDAGFGGGANLNADNAGDGPDDLGQQGGGQTE